MNGSASAELTKASPVLVRQLPDQHCRLEYITDASLPCFPVIFNHVVSSGGHDYKDITDR